MPGSQLPPSDNKSDGSGSGSALFYPLPSWNKQMGSFFLLEAVWEMGSCVNAAGVISFSIFSFSSNSAQSIG